MKHLVWIVTLIAMLALGGMMSAQDSGPLADSQWTLLSLNGEAPLDGTQITMNFNAEGQVSGSAGCNNYTATYTAAGGTLTLSTGASTMMACPDAIMIQEQTYLDALGAVTGYSLDAGQLVIAYGDADQTLVLGRTPTLNDADWSLVSIADEPLVEETQITLSFGADSMVGGSAGCNSFSGGYTADGETLSFDANLAITMMACPETIMTQEQAFLDALTQAEIYTLTADALSISTADGQTLVFEAVYRVTAQHWSLMSIDDEVLVENTQITLSFDDTRGFGSAGCNTYNASYEITGADISFGAAASTRMACPGDITAQEQAYLEALSIADSYSVTADTLTLSSEDGLTLIFEALPVVTVEVRYRERIALAPDAQITVTLEDISLADAPAEVISSQTISAEGGSVPFTVELPYDPTQIEQNRSYAVHTEIREGETLRFTTDTIYSVLTGGSLDRITLVLIMVD